MSYHRIVQDGEGLLTVVEMEESDEVDYRPSQFLRRESGTAYRFDTEEEAVSFLNREFKLEHIAPEYRRLTPDQVAYMRRDS